MIGFAGYWAAYIKEQAERDAVEKDRRALLEAETVDWPMSPVAPLSPRAREAFTNIGLMD